MKELPLRAQYSVVRCEASRLPVPEEEQTTLWSLTPMHGHGNLFFLAGHLLSKGEEGISQAQVMALVESTDGEFSGEFADLVEVLDTGHVVENLYDLARRTVSAQAALCDWWPELPHKAPDFELDLSGETSFEDHEASEQLEFP
ncbi:hypothetical protein [Nesterenkonia sp. CF4.4]|uniref:hypothetical protein n=1 Tax=Nesterenkonia sp. CF4.4 TaxID=3373079 RepID=UPI003EE7185B